MTTSVNGSTQESSVSRERDDGLLKLSYPPPVKRVRRGLRWFFTGIRPEPRPSHIGTVEDPDRDAVGICCSGGGIRSAAFNLGALQALEKRGVLRGARYLSAVSGGAYIAAAFCMVAKRGTKADDSDADAFSADRPPFHPGSPEEQYLRNRSSYLAPDGLSKLFLAYRVLLGLVFNLIFLGLALVAIGVALGWAVYRPLYGALADPVARCAGGTGVRCRFAADVPDLFWWVLGAFGLAILVNGLLLLLLRPASDFVRRGLETWAIRLMLSTAALAVVLVAIPALAAALLNYGNESGAQAAETASAPSLPAVGAGSFGTVLVAILLQLRARASEPATVLQAVTGFRGFFMRLGSRTRVAFAYVAGAVAGPLLLVAIVVLAASLTLADSDRSGTDPTMLIVGAASAAAFVAVYFLADLNTWSLHPFYRRRLCTAFALRRVLDDDGRPKAEERKYSRLVPLSQSGVDEPDWPMLIVCAAANVSDPGATPPGRGVTSFTFSPTAIGGPLVGAEPTSTYERVLGMNRKRDITLAAAVAMSGAALSPSMGKQTRRPLTFLMALANVRLGVWVPNPCYVAKWDQRGFGNSDDRRDFFKMPRPKYLFRELLGRNRLDAKFLYVSDGGHYENLGLVELLRRGCTKIYCFDASGGESFTALGDAVALARSELGVEIDIDPRQLVPDKDRHLAARDCVSAPFRYANGEPGVLVYARTVMTEAVPFDVAAYHDADPLFPHNSTADQLYNDQKFEAYRALGWCAGGHAADEMTAPTFGAAPVQTPVAHIARNGDSEPLVSVPVGGSYRLNLRQALRSMRA